MKKLIRSLVILFLIVAISNESVIAKTSVNYTKNKIFATVPPTPNPQYLYYCLNEVAIPLSAIPAVGGTLNWYGTNATGGTASSIPPTPSTNTAATGSNPLKYYVTQTVGGVESSPRTVIYVYVNQQLDLFCDLSKTTPTSVGFDFANVGQASFTYSYSIAGGPPVAGTWSAPSSFVVLGVLPGQSVSFTLTAVGAKPCVIPTQTAICRSDCPSLTTPTFNPIPSFCAGTSAPSLPSSSTNAIPITGTWSPALINNTTSGSYVFTPNPILFPCASTQTMSITVDPLVTSAFTGIPAVVCQGAMAPILPLSSSNVTPITGTWSPATVNTSVLGSVIYTFTPNLGKCASSTLSTVTIRIDPVLTPTFAPVPAICSGAVLAALPTKSINSVTGTWSPALNNTVTTTYTFTPTAGQCATKQTLAVTITPKTVTNFAAIPPFCSGTPAPVLAPTSPNGVTGTWLPATINNTASGDYIFTPNPIECATNQTLNVIVNPQIVPSFVDRIICSGTSAPVLATTSPNGITGTWSPTTVSNTTTGTYLFTPDAPQCATNKTITVTVNPSNTIASVTADVVSSFFDENQEIKITVTGTGNYLYQLDDGPFQTDNFFENVGLGLHSITVKDVNGCSTAITIYDILVINYPKYFTPNGDSYNDTWNIVGLKDQVSTRIYIFDRYGKLLKDISPSGPGWDGNYIGKPMPATDYWFTVEYSELNNIKKFKSHFSLKR